MRAIKPTSNRVYVKLDTPNDHIERVKGARIEIDTTYQPEKHITRTGTVIGVPESLVYYKTHTPEPEKAKMYDERYMEEFARNNPPRSYGGLPWKTEMELQVGDRVVMYFLAVDNCMKQGAYEKEYEFYNGIMNMDKKEEFIYVKYQNIYAVIRDEKVIPINGYVLVEPITNPVQEQREKEAEAKKIKLVSDDKPSNTNAVYGRIVYIGKPNIEYREKYMSDEGYDDLKEGDEVIMKKISDIPMEYEYHAKVDGGRKLFRVQRHDIIATI
jgi:hypothetical protein